MREFGVGSLPVNWRDWRFGFVVRKRQRYGRDIELCFGPFALEVSWRNWP